MNSLNIPTISATKESSTQLTPKVNMKIIFLTSMAMEVAIEMHLKGPAFTVIHQWGYQISKTGTAKWLYNNKPLRDGKINLILMHRKNITSILTIMIKLDKIQISRTLQKVSEVLSLAVNQLESTSFRRLQKWSSRRFSIRKWVELITS